jgi:hypothetical protein
VTHGRSHHHALACSTAQRNSAMHAAQAADSCRAAGHSSIEGRQRRACAIDCRRKQRRRYRTERIGELPGDHRTKQLTDTKLARF